MQSEPIGRGDEPADARRGHQLVLAPRRMSASMASLVPLPNRAR
jgi:hypothetical protein